MTQPDQHPQDQDPGNSRGPGQPKEPQPLASLLAHLRQQDQADIAKELLEMTQDRPRKPYRPQARPETYTPSWTRGEDTSTAAILAAHNALLPSLDDTDREQLDHQLTDALTAHNRAITHAYQDPDLRTEDHLLPEVQQAMPSPVLMEPITFRQAYQGDRIHRAILAVLSADDPDPQAWSEQTRALGAADLQAQFSRRLMHNTAQGSTPYTWEHTQHTQVKAGARFLNLLWSSNPDAVQEIAASASLEQDYPPNVNLFLEETGIQIFQAFQEVAASTTEAAAFHLANAIATVLSLEAILAGHQNAREMTRRLGKRQNGNAPYSPSQATQELLFSLIRNEESNCRYACRTIRNTTRNFRKSVANWSPPLPVDHVIP